MRKLTDPLTTGQAARLCGLGFPCINRAIDTGDLKDLKGFLVPGSKHRRVEPESQNIAIQSVKLDT